ncbi:serine/arginine repetitive matrix protein 1-like [Palaemon carinicauda]|uniref:serine/arginine repetitive matrix protein 1-like n=1 Tax=Palaemon carinicauda TaxID=392227 RepID=UPI0035B6864A
MRTCPGLPGRPCGTFMSAVDTDPHTLCPHCRGQWCDSGNGSSARPQPTVLRFPPAVPDLARQRSPAHTRPPAPQRPPVPATSRAVQEAPRLAHRRSQVPLDSQRPSGVGREARPSRAVPDTAHTRSPTRQCASTSQRAVQEVPKLAHGRSQVPLDSPSRLRNPVRAPPVVRDVPVARQVPVALKAPHATQQCTPVRPNPIARPSQQRTPARPARPYSPQVNIPAQTAQRSPARQHADPSSCYHEAALSRPRPVLPDTLPRATAHSRPTVPHQVTARPRIQPSTPPHDPVPARHTPSPSPTHARAISCAPPRPRHQPRTPAPLPGQGSSRDLQRDRRQADRSSFRSPPRKRRTAHSPEEGRFPDRSKNSLISASLKANPRLLTPPRDRTIPFPPEGVSDSATVSQQPWFKTLVRAIMQAMKPVLSDLGHKSVAAASPLNWKRGVPSMETSPRAILSPRKSLRGNRRTLKTIPKSSARIRQEPVRPSEDVHESPQEEPMGTGDFVASP